MEVVQHQGAVSECEEQVYVNIHEQARQAQVYEHEGEHEVGRAEQG